MLERRRYTIARRRAFPPLPPPLPPPPLRKVVTSLRRKCRELRHGYDADIVEARINSPRRKKVRETGVTRPPANLLLSLSFVERRAKSSKAANFYPTVSLCKCFRYVDGFYNVSLQFCSSSFLQPSRKVRVLSLFERWKVKSES